MPEKLEKKKKLTKRTKKEESLMVVVNRMHKKFAKEIQAEGKKRGIILDVHVIIKEVEEASQEVESSNLLQEES
jgi:hypothetical protein